MEGFLVVALPCGVAVECKHWTVNKNGPSPVGSVSCHAMCVCTANLLRMNVTSVVTCESNNLAGYESFDRVGELLDQNKINCADTFKKHQR